MGRSARPKFYLTLRDKNLFEYLFLNKLATAAQIKRDIFGIADLKGVLRRLRTLIRHGYVHRLLSGDNVARYAYSVTNKSFEMYLRARTTRQWSQLKSDSPDHDVALVDIRARLCSGPKVAHYFTENAIESGLFDHPDFPSDPFLEMHSDAVIVLRAGGRSWNLAIEYEDVQKSRERYHSHLSSYFLQTKINGVLYVAREAKLRDLLVKIESTLWPEMTSKVFFGLLPDVLNRDKPLHFFNRNGNRLELD